MAHGRIIFHKFDSLKSEARFLINQWDIASLDKRELTNWYWLTL